VILYIILRTSVCGGLNVLWFNFQSRFKRKKVDIYVKNCSTHGFILLVQYMFGLMVIYLDFTVFVGLF